MAIERINTAKLFTCAAALVLIAAGCGEKKSATTNRATPPKVTIPAATVPPSTEVATIPKPSMELEASVGPGFQIGISHDGEDLASSSDTLPAGTYSVTVVDKADSHNFHLMGPGVDKASGVAEASVDTWSVELTKGTYTFVCDPHAGSMKGSFKVA